MSEQSSLSVSDDGAVRVLTLNRPHKRNAFDTEMAGALWDQLERAGNDDSVRVVVVTGAGNHFCAGVDMKVFGQLGGDGLEGMDQLVRLHEALDALEKPSIAAVRGRAVGMGVTMLPHFDLVYAARDATFLTPFATLGIVLEYGSSFTLPRLIGRQRASELILRGKPIDAATALEWGLVTRTFASDLMMTRVLEIGSDIAENPPFAVTASKRLLRQGEQSTLQQAVERENEVLARCYGSEENLRAVRAFFESRGDGSCGDESSS